MLKQVLTIQEGANKGKKLHIILGGKKSNYPMDEDLWDFPIEELLDGTIEVREVMWYYYENGRCYETYLQT